MSLKYVPAKQESGTLVLIADGVTTAGTSYEVRSFFFITLKPRVE